jgi:hypothetical protein
MKRLRRKQEKFCEIIANNPEVDNKQAYHLSYPKANESTCEVNSTKLLNNPVIQSRISQLLDRQGLSDTELNLRLKKLSQAKKVLINKGKLIEVEDNSIQLESIKTAYKLHGYLSNTESSTYEDNRSINISLSSEELTRLEGIVQGIKSLKDKARAELL